MSDSAPIQPATSRRPRRAVVLLAFAIGIAGLILWFSRVTPARHDPLFRGKPESEWVKNLKYWDDQQVKEWRAYGEEGVQVLIRGLQKANHPGERAYRRWHRRLPAFLVRWLPASKPDSTRATRMCLVSLISSLGTAANSATPVMIRTVRNDEAASVIQIAIGYFNSSEDENCLLNKLPADQKNALLPALIHALQDPANWGLRNNAAQALKYYPEQRKVVAPVLVSALQDPEPHVRLLAAEALNRVDPAAAQKAGTTAIIVAITKNPDDQIAYRGVAALGHARSRLDLAVPAIVECLQNTNTLVACQAVWSLEWSSREFNAWSNTIVPALRTAAQRQDNAGGYARKALARWTPTPDPAIGPK